MATMIGAPPAGPRIMERPHRIIPPDLLAANFAQTRLLCVDLAEYRAWLQLNGITRSSRGAFCGEAWRPRCRELALEHKCIMVIEGRTIPPDDDDAS